MYSGCDDNILPFIAAGGKGVISVLSNLYPRETEMFAQAALKGDLELARKMAYDLNDVSKYLFIDVNPIMPKAALKHMVLLKVICFVSLLFQLQKKIKSYYLMQ